jgi:hypothetical protein
MDWASSRPSPEQYVNYKLNKHGFYGSRFLIVCDNRVCSAGMSLCNIGMMVWTEVWLVELGGNCWKDGLKD